MTYVTAKDIVIPAGTPVGEAPWRTERAVPFASVLIATSKDSTAELVIPLDEAIKLGLVVEAPAKAA